MDQLSAESGRSPSSTLAGERLAILVLLLLLAAAAWVLLLQQGWHGHGRDRSPDGDGAGALPGDLGLLIMLVPELLPTAMPRGTGEMGM